LLVRSHSGSDLFTTQTDHVARADKTAAMPEIGRGSAIEGLNASGAGYSLPTVGDQGKGPLQREAEAPK
jgi:hypothetical protein